MPHVGRSGPSPVLGGGHPEQTEQCRVRGASDSMFTGHLKVLQRHSRENHDAQPAACQLDPTGRYDIYLIVLGWFHMVDGPA